MATAQKPKKLKSGNNPLIYIILTLAIPFLLCNFFAIVGVSAVLIADGFEPDNASEIAKVNSNSSAQDDNNDNYFRTYIDPDIDSESDNFIVKSLDTFTYVVADGTDQDRYEYEREFILANLQNEYEILSVLFDYGFDREITIELTDSQDYYEQLFSFDYLDELPYAGLTTTDKILFYINPEVGYSKLGLKDVIAHELVHLFQQYSVDDGLYNYPKWFSEGTAEFYSRTSQQKPLEKNENFVKFTSLQILSYAFETGDLENTRDAYNASYHFVSYLEETYGEEKLLRIMLPEVPFPAFYFDFEQVYGVKPDVIYENWHRIITDLPPETYEGNDIDRSYDDYVQYMEEKLSDEAAN